jgi:hypothetical protein
MMMMTMMMNMMIMIYDVDDLVVGGDDGHQVG